jgi:phosphoribosylformimino-5-aminoimidazole carboxamide ribotide isomerase
MQLIPAIDLLGGKVVRLTRGDFGRATVYSFDPVAVARRWVEEGATRLHIVDLDGARSGQPVQAALIGAIVEGVDVPCQVAGGIRTLADVRAALQVGADRVVLGTALLRSPDLAVPLITEHGNGAIVAAIDVRGGRAVGEGWSRTARGLDGIEAVRQLLSAGVEWFAVTAIDRDGLLGGPDLILLDAVARAAPDANIIASAGVGAVEDLEELARRGFAGAILGRALYEGTVDLRRALDAVAAWDLSC